MSVVFVSKTRRSWAKRYRHAQWGERIPKQFRLALPSVITVFGMCLGLSAIRFAFAGTFEYAVICVLAASLFDVADGRVARFLGSESDFGAELDSLADFLCYGVAPSVMAYFFTLSHWAGVGWPLCLFFTTCSALRLARFNVYRLLPAKVPWGDRFFIGLPAPGGAFVALLPFMIYFACGVTWIFPWSFLLTLALGGGLMVSRLPTLALKRFRFSKRQLPLVLLMASLVTGGLLSAPWSFAAVLVVGYIASMPLSVLWIRRHYGRRTHLDPKQPKAS
jgi:CDP-diacylglycerol--serine O-phosphatidyltransferase